MRPVFAIVAVLGLAGVARADPPRAAAAVGAGTRGDEAVAALELRGDWAADGFAGGVGLRLRAVGTSFRREDWDDAADWLGLVRYLEWRGGQVGCDQADAIVEDCRGAAVALGALAAIDLAGVVEGYSAALDADGPHTGAIGAARYGRLRVDAAIDDVIAPAVIGTRGEHRGEVFSFAGAVAADPSAPSQMDSAPLAIATAGVSARTQHGLVISAVDGGVGTLLGHGLGAWAGVSTAYRGTRGAVELRLEATAGSGGYSPAPFSPLYRIERVATDPMAPTLLDRARDGALGGFGGAATLALRHHALGRLDLAARAAPGLGGVTRVRALLDANRTVQAGAWLAARPAQGTWAAAAELRALFGKQWFGAGEATRLFSAEGPDGLHPLWQVTLWIGAQTGE